jgi:hypothetical protein
MTKVNGYLVTVTEVKTMLPLKGTPADSNKIVTKQDVLDNFYVDLNAEPFASYTVNRCPRYEDLINPCSYGFGINNVTINCTSYSGATVSTAIASTTGYYQIALVNATTFALITAWQYYAGAPNPATVFTFTNVPNGNFKIALEASNSPSYCRVYSNTYTVDCAVTLALNKNTFVSGLQYYSPFLYYIDVYTTYGSTANSPGQTVTIEDQLDTLKLTDFSIYRVSYEGINRTGDGSYYTVVANNSPTGYFKLNLLREINTTKTYRIEISATPTIMFGSISNTAYTYFPAPFSPILQSTVTTQVTTTIRNCGGYRIQNLDDFNSIEVSWTTCDGAPGIGATIPPSGFYETDCALDGSVNVTGPANITKEYTC